MKFQIVFAFLFLGMGLARGQNLLENGSFEVSRSLDPRNGATIARNTQIDSWTIGGANGIMYVDRIMTASDGNRCVQLQFVTANYIEQTILTVPGQSYRVAFDVSAYVGPDGAGARMMRGKATARAGETIIATKDFSHDGTGKRFPDVGWSNFSYDFTATDAQTTLRWESTESGNTGGPCVDSARVFPGHLDGDGNWVISGPPVLTKRLAGTTQAVVGRPLTMEVEALGDAPLSYQWFRVNGSTYTAIANATGPVYEIASFAANQAGSYAVVVSNALASVTNVTAVVRVSPPIISGQPDEQHVSVGQNLSMGPRSFSGSAPDRFQWYKDGVALPGQTNQNFTKSSATLDDAGQYYVWAANIAGETTSSNVTVMVFDGPVPPWIRFNQLPPQRAVQEGGSLFLTVGGEGAFPLTYLWYKDGVLVHSSTQNSYSKNGVTPEDAGQYSVTLSNVAGVVTSSTTEVIVYPPQEAPQFSGFNVNTNVAEGVDFTLAPQLVRGSHLVYQWYKRALTDFQAPGTPIPGANSLELPLGVITYDKAAQYTLVATNFVGQNQITYILNVIAKPIFSSPLQGYEGPAGQLVTLSANIANYTPSLTYQWYKDGQVIAGATEFSYRFTAGATSAGSYIVVAKNEAGETTSSPATVVLREVTPASREYHLVGDYTVDVPGRPGMKMLVVGDGHLRNGVVTFQSTLGAYDVGGLYRWQQGVRSKIVDLNDSLPTLSAPATWYDGLSPEEGGILHFLALSTNSSPNRASVFERQNGQTKAIITQENDIPGKPGVRARRFGYANRAGGRTAFFATDNEQFGSGGYRCVLVWDGSKFQNWVSSDSPLPAGDGIWWSNSSQVGFDGSTLAFWATDRTGEDGSRNGIFMSVNGSPLQKIAFTGDPVPGGLGTFRAFNSPPRVHDGKVLFLGQRESGGNLLLEYVNGTLRVVAKAGDAPAGGGAFSSLVYGFDYSADGSILFSASGPGQKQGIYSAKDGAITEVLTTLNSINGRVLRFVSLYDADGMDLLIGASFDGTRFGLYTTADGSAPVAPRISVTRTSTSMTLSWGGAGQLQESSNLGSWSDVSAASPYEAQFSAGSGRYYRVIQR